MYPSRYASHAFFSHWGSPAFAMHVTILHSLLDGPVKDQQRGVEARADQTTTSEPADEPSSPGPDARHDSDGICYLTSNNDVARFRYALILVIVNGAWCRNAKGADGHQCFLAYC
jgi:hypothetical protein